MSNTAETRKKPGGLARAFYRAPIYLYRIGLGGLMGGRFLLINHVGRKSGLPRQTVVEVARHDKESGIYAVASGYGSQADWYRNLRANPLTTIQVGRKPMAVTADILTPEQSGEEMVRYARTYPRTARTLMKRVLGYEIDGDEASYRTLGADRVPFILFRPRSESPAS